VDEGKTIGQCRVAPVEHRTRTFLVGCGLSLTPKEPATDRLVSCSDELVVTRASDRSEEKKLGFVAGDDRIAGIPVLDRDRRADDLIAAIPSSGSEGD
jgi:hypothetical protein